MRLVLSIILSILACSQLRATPHLLDSFDFNAPIVSSTSGVSDKQVGMIIYDLSTNQFKGLNNAGSWDAFSIPNGNPVTSGGTERIERLTFGGSSNPSDCSGNGTTCTIYNQSSAWYTSVVRGGSAGSYTLTIANGVFSAAPSCFFTVVNAASGGNAFVYYGSPLPTATTVLFYAENIAGSPSNIDVMGSIVCVGPR